MNRLLLNILLLPALLSSWYPLAGQQDRFAWRAGIYGGIVSYYGDLTDKFRLIQPTKRTIQPLQNIDPETFGLSVETSLSPAWSAGFSYTQGTFLANDRAINWNNELQTSRENFGRSLNARTKVKAGNFFIAYYTDNDKLFGRSALLAPFLKAGAGFTHFEVFGDLYHGPGQDQRYYYWEDLSVRNLPEGSPQAAIISPDRQYETKLTDLQTEGGNYRTTVLTPSAALGLKFRLFDRLNLNLEYQLFFPQTDFLDDVSGRFPQEYDSPEQEYASNPADWPGPYRGDPDGENDLFSFASISVFYNFGRKRTAFLAPAIRVGLLAPDTSNLEKAISTRKDTVGAEQQPIRNNQIKDTAKTAGQPLRTEPEDTRTVRTEPGNKISSAPAAEPDAAAPAEAIPRDSLVNDLKELRAMMADNAKKQARRDSFLLYEIRSLQTSLNRKARPEPQTGRLRQASPDTVFVHLLDTTFESLLSNLSLQLQNQEKRIARLEDSLLNVQKPLPKEIAAPDRNEQEPAVAATLGDSLEILKTRNRELLARLSGMADSLEHLEQRRATLPAQEDDRPADTTTLALQTKIMLLQAQLEAAKRRDTTSRSRLQQELNVLSRQSNEAVWAEIKALRQEIERLKERPAPLVLKQTSPEAGESLLQKKLEGQSQTTVFFNSGSARLSPKALGRLQQPLQLLRMHPRLRAVISGFADPSGSAAANEQLARRRALAAFQYFKDQGIDDSRLSLGQGRIDYSITKPEQGRRAEVELIIISGE